VVLAGGWSGYALPDDTLSGTGLRVFEGILLAVPVIGTSLAGLVFGGGFPGQIIERLYWLHVLVVPIALLVVFALRLRLAGRRRVAGDAVWVSAPGMAARAAGLFFITMGVLFVMGGTLTIAPVWLYGPAAASDASNGSQPDWYTGFLDGALRLVPPGWEVTWIGGTWPLGVLVPQLVVGVFLLIVVTYPFLEELVTGDRRPGHDLDRPRDAPVRTGIGVAGLVFFGTLWAAAGTDVIATHFDVAIEAQVYLLRATLFVGPLIAYQVTTRICLGLQARERDMVDHGFETGILQRTAGGGYVAVHAPVSADQRRRIAPVRQQLER
jgi:ubiquinol-cytochrome c reductase cytochrome b subunit